MGAIGSLFAREEDLKKELKSKGITPDKEIICYCHSGTRASYKYMQFTKAGYEKVQLYDGSIIDWAQQRNSLK